MATSMFASDSHARDAHAGHVMAEMNVTPLVDVMLVLLIIFMIAAPLVTRTLEMRIPQTSRETTATIPPRLQLEVLADGSFVLDGMRLGQGGLEAALAQTAKAAPRTVVELTVHADADYQAFTRALTAARNSGLQNIALGQ